MYNSECERKEREAKSKTVSIWTDVVKNLSKYKNCFYTPYFGIMAPNCGPYKLRFWEEYFLKWNNTIEGGKVYIDEKRNVFVKSSLDFFTTTKNIDKHNLENLNNKLNDLCDVLKDVYLKTKDTPEIYDKFSETTKFYISSLTSSESNKDD
jgi:hypothetical protein